MSTSILGFRVANDKKRKLRKLSERLGRDMSDSMRRATEREIATLEAEVAAYEAELEKLRSGA